MPTLEEIAAAFEKFDTDPPGGDGKLSKDELKGILTRPVGGGEMTAEEAQAFIDKWDTDGDGKLSIAELANAISNKLEKEADQFLADQSESQDSGAADTYPIQAGQIHKGGYIMIKGRPCKVSEVKSSKTGKHGHAKCHFYATDIFTGKTMEDMVLATRAKSEGLKYI